MIVAIEFHFPAGTKAKRGTCMGCGCRDDRACHGGCFWIDPSHLVCSACLDSALDAIALGTPKDSEVSNVSAAQGEFVSLTVPLAMPPAPARRSKKKTKARRSRR